MSVVEYNFVHVASCLALLISMYIYTHIHTYIYIYIYAETQNCGIDNNYVLQLKVSCSTIIRKMVLHFKNYCFNIKFLKVVKLYLHKIT